MPRRACKETAVPGRCPVLQSRQGRHEGAGLYYRKVGQAKHAVGGYLQRTFPLGHKKECSVLQGISSQTVISNLTQREGKTYISENLAIVFAKSGKRTLLVGGDLRRPKIYADFNLSNGKFIPFRSL